MKKALILVTSLAALAVLIAATQGIAQSDSKTTGLSPAWIKSVAEKEANPEKKKARKHDGKFRKQATAISLAVTATWTCESQRGVTRTPFTSAEDPWSLPRSLRIRDKVLNTWKLKKKACIKALHAHDDVIRRLQRGLAGTPMSGSEKELEAAGRLYHVSPYFIAAIAATESSLGVAACANNRYNAFGLSSCGAGWTVPNFQSWGEAYRFMAAFLTGHTRVTRGWPGARTTYDYHGYAACSSCWGSHTAAHMQRLFGVGNSVYYA